MVGIEYIATTRELDRKSLSDLCVVLRLINLEREGNKRASRMVGK